MTPTTAAEPAIDAEKQLREEVSLIHKRGSSITVTDQASYDAACAFLTKEVKPRITRVEEYWEGDIKAAHSLHKSLINKRTELLTPLLTIEKAIKTGICKFAEEQERARLAEQRRLEEEARKQEEEAKLQTAIAAEEAGASEEEKQVILDTPTYAAPVVAAPLYSKADGVSVKGNWRAEVDDVVKLCKFVAENPQYKNLVEANQSALNNLARTMQTSFNIGGCRAVSGMNVAARSTK